MTKTVDANNIQFDVDVILSELGGFGKFQAFNFALICISVVVSSVTSLTYVFATGNLNYRCKISECDTEPAPVYEPNWLIHAVPYSHDSPEKCIRYMNTVDSATQCYDINLFNTTQEISCDKFVYETDEITLLNEFDLTCEENEWKLAFVGTVNGLALLVAIPVLGILSDRYGRRTLFVFGLFLSSVFGLLKSFSNSYNLYIICEFLEAAVGGGAYATSFVLAMELLEANRRVIGGTLLASSYTIGEILLGVIAMNISNFRTLLQIAYTPLVLVISYLWLVPESVRWLAIKGRRQEAAKTILRAAKINSIQLSDRVLDMLKATDSNVEEKNTSESTDRKEESFFDVLRSKVILGRMAIGSFCWITNALVYYGLSLNSVNLAGSKHINFMLVCAAEIPGYLITIVVMQRIGRKWSLCGAMIVCGLACLGSEYLPDDQPFIRLVLFLIGKSAISVSFTVLYVYSSELYPTNLRNSLMCVCSMIGRVGSIAAPQTPLLIRYNPSLPLLLFGTISIASGFLVLRLPETLNANLPDTIEEAEQLGKNSRSTKM